MRQIKISNKVERKQGETMKMIELRRGNVDIEHEGEMFRLWGELSDKCFYVTLSWIERLTPEKQTIPISKEEQEQVMHLVMDYWHENDKCPICFTYDNVKVICKTHQEPEPKKTLGEKVKDWFSGNK